MKSIRPRVIDLRELRYQWFDHILKGGARAALLKDRVNYEVMGANEWRHAPSLEAMAGGSLRFYLDASASGERHRLDAAQEFERCVRPADGEFRRSHGRRLDAADRSHHQKTGSP